MCIRQGLCIACLILPCISLWADEPSLPPPEVVPAEPEARQPVRFRVADVQVESQQVETLEEIPAEMPGRGRCCPPGASRAGCWDRMAFWLRDSHWGYCEFFSERPFGTLVNAHMQTQAWNGLADQTVLYRYDFVNEQGRDRARLNPRGQQQLKKFANVQRTTGLPLVIEQTLESPGLDDARRQSVLAALGQLGAPVIPELVVVGKPNAFGVSAEEGELIYPNQLLQTQERGRQRISTGSIGGGSGGGR